MSRVASRILQLLFFVLIVRPVVFLLFGINVRNRRLLPTVGPAVIAANHNSHLDTVVLMALVPLASLHRVRPVAAADYFTRGPLMSWFSRTFINIIPIDRTRLVSGDPLLPCYAALARGDILIFFPEGSRQEPEQLGVFKPGLARLVERCPTAHVVPVFMHGLGKAWPKGSALIVPFIIDVFVGHPLHWRDDRGEFMARFAGRIEALGAQGSFPGWA